MRRTYLILAAALCFSPLFVSQGGQDTPPPATAANTRYVAVQTAAVKDSAGFFAKEVGSLSLGTEVSAVRENGNWTEVRAGNLSGWVASSSLTARRVISSNAKVSANEFSMAGKAFSPDMEIIYKKDGLDYSMVDSMEGINIPANDLQNFISEGRLKEGK